jgi:hypothetical protein
MPKLDATQILERLEKRLEELEAGKEVAAKDIRALLTDEQHATLEAAWAAQQALRKGSRARTEEEQRALGWKSKREVRIEAFKQAITEAEKGLLPALQKMQRDAEVRQGRIYFDSLIKATDMGLSMEEAKIRANNDLVRAGLPRLDGREVNRTPARDKRIIELDKTLKKQMQASMSEDELEQQKILEEHERATEKKNRKV